MSRRGMRVPTGVRWLRRLRRLSRALLPALLATAPMHPAGAAAAPAVADAVTIELAWTGEGLELTYTPPAGVRELQRVLDTPSARAVWASRVRSLDGCARIDGLSIVGRDDRPASADCRAWRFAVTPGIVSESANYQAALALGDSGVLLYTGYWAAVVPGHPLVWRFEAPTGGHVLHQGALRAADVEQRSETAARGGLTTHERLRALGASQYVVLGRTAHEPLSGGVLVHDGRVDSATCATVVRTLRAALEGFAALYRRAPAGPIGVALSRWTAAGWSGDVSDGRMMALRLPGGEAPLADGVALQRFVVHEVAHWWNMGVFRSDGERSPWLHEGHADALSLLWLHRRGVLDDVAARTLVVGAAERCIERRGDRPAATLAPGFTREDDPYACGMTLMLTALAERLAREPGGSPSATAERPTFGAALDALATLHLADRTLDAAGFARWADGADGGPMHALVLDPSRPFASSLVERWRALGLGDEADATAAPSESTRQQLGAALVRTLMEADCGGRFGFWGLSDGFRLDPAARCATLRGGSDLLDVAGVALRREPVAAWRAVAAACAPGRPAAERRIVLRYRSAWRPDRLACPATWPEPPRLRALVLAPGALERLGLR